MNAPEPWDESVQPSRNRSRSRPPRPTPTLKCGPSTDHEPRRQHQTRATAQSARINTGVQLSDGTPEKQREVLNNAYAVLKVWPNTASIKVVAFGPGVALLYADSPLRKQVDSLIAEGVEFDVCMNTIETITRKTGHTPLLDPKATKVPYGVPRLMALAAKGYVIIRP
ncbi:MAG: DsrE family protein [Acidiphilium sp.]